MADYCGISCNNYWMTHSNATANSSHGNAEKRASLKSLIQLVWPNCGAFKRIIYRWTTIKCHAPYAIIIVSIFWERFKANATATSKCFDLSGWFFCFQSNLLMLNFGFQFFFHFFHRFLRNPTELKSIKNISLLRQQPPPAAASSNQTLNGSRVKQEPSTHPSNTTNGNTQLGAHLNVQSLLHQQQQPPPSSPRVHALNGAFHYLSTAANVPDRSSPPQSHSSSHSDMDDQPTDLSTSARTSNPDCYPWVYPECVKNMAFSTLLSPKTNKIRVFIEFRFRLIRNSNGLTTIRLIQPNSPQPQQMDDYPSIKSENGDRTSPMATDLRKMD